MTFIHQKIGFALLLAAVSSSCVAQSQSEVNTYRYKSDGVREFYSKQEITGCFTEVRIHHFDSVISMEYGAKCEEDPQGRVTVDSMAESLVDIVAHYNLYDTFERKHAISVNFHWKISHWPLYEYINANEKWPPDVFRNLNAQYPDESLRLSKYKELLGDSILSPHVYYPLVTAMERIGCTLRLSDSFVDPLYVDDHAITKNKMISWGVFKPYQANKDIYPRIKGPIEFDLSCGNGKTGLILPLAPTPRTPG